jgi:hypothetical protein
MTDLRTAAQRLLEAIDRALPEAPLCSAFDVVADTADDLRAALAYREDKAQAAFEHWLVEKLLTVTQAQMAHAEAVENLTVKESLTVEPCNKSCAPGYCYCEPIIQPEIKDDKPFGYFRAEPFGWTDCAPTDEGAIPLYTHPPRQCRGLTEEEVFHVENNVPDSVISDRQWTVYFARAIEAKLKERNNG